MNKSSNKLVRAIKIACRKPVIVSGLRLALVVGILLNLINQWQAITTMDMQMIHWPKLLLTFCVPYLVSTYASVVTVLRGYRDDVVK